MRKFPVLKHHLLIEILYHRSHVAFQHHLVDSTQMLHLKNMKGLSVHITYVVPHDAFNIQLVQNAQNAILQQEDALQNIQINVMCYVVHLVVLNHTVAVETCSDLVSLLELIIDVIQVHQQGLITKTTYNNINILQHCM